MTFIDPATLPGVVPTTGPCHPWTDLATVRAQCGLLVADADDVAVGFGIDLASLVLWSSSGRRFGLCERTIRPCFDGESRCGMNRADINPASYPPGSVSNYGHRGQGCGCRIPQLVLPGPIAYVTEVMYNGATIPLADLKIKTAGEHARRALLRVDGDGWWCCNDLDTDPTVVATDNGCPAWHVNYWQGQPVDTTAVKIASMLAEQIARQYCTSAGCDDRMVAGLTRVARRGITKEYNPELLKDESGQVRTGLPYVDQWVDVVNPHGKTRPSMVVRPDSPERRRLWSWVDAA